jgi:glycosyltransferase involved in cell wall biosynthesis
MKDNGRGDFNVLLIGEEPPENTLDEISGAIVELDLSNVVKKIGQKADIANWIQASDVLILPSHEEGMGRVVLEAMACGTPVIGGNVGGIKEAITEEVGLLITPESPEELSLAIEKLLDNKPLRDRMGIAGRKRALEYFDITVHAVNMMNLFQEMVMQNEN